MFPFMGGFGQQHSPHGRFTEYYRAYPLSQASEGSRDRSAVVNYGGKIWMPPSALAKLASLHIEYPMLFRISNQVQHDLHTHCGVLEFVAEEGRVYLPQWMMEQLKVERGDIIKVHNANLPLGKFLKIQPQSVDFLDISDPKAVLENALRQYSTITKGDMIQIHYNNKLYKLLCMEIKPEGDGISIVETDLEVDFAPPVGYQEPQHTGASRKASTANSLTIDEHKVVEEKRWNAFQGSGSRLNNKPISAPSPLKNAAVENGAQQPAEEGPSILRLPKNKLWFGYKVDVQQPAGEETMDTDKKENAFIGSGQSLRK